MRKLLLVLAALLTITTVNAQTPKNLEKALADSKNPKKTEAPATWVKLGNAYMEAYDLPTKGIWQGATQLEVKMLLKDQAIKASTQEEIAGRTFNVDEYQDKKLYYDEKGVLQAWIVSSYPVEGQILILADEAFNTAIAKDVKKAQSKPIIEGLNSLKTKFINEAMNHYTLGDSKKAAENFENSLKISNNPVINVIDSTIIYYTAVTASMAGDSKKAIKYFEECLKINYDQKGDVYSTLAESYKTVGDTLKAKELLGAGFTKYPTSQSILVSLINVYQESNDDPNKILELIKVAQKNEPSNASLYYAEGNILKKMGKFDEAIAIYNKSLEVDPKYFFAPFAAGDAYYSHAIELQDLASKEMDDAKYSKYIKELEDALLSAIAPFEKAFAITEEVDFKAACAEYLKNIYFRFREKSPEFQANYEKYNKYVEDNRK